MTKQTQATGDVVAQILEIYSDYSEIANLVMDDKLEVVEQEGGGEGGAEDCVAVFKWKDKYYQVEYSYYSYNGYETDGSNNTVIEVKPVEKTITVYEPV